MPQQLLRHVLPAITHGTCIAAVKGEGAPPGPCTQVKPQGGKCTGAAAATTAAHRSAAVCTSAVRANERKPPANRFVADAHEKKGHPKFWRNCSGRQPIHLMHRCPLLWIRAALWQTIQRRPRSTPTVWTQPGPMLLSDLARPFTSPAACAGAAAATGRLVLALACRRQHARLPRAAQCCCYWPQRTKEPSCRRRRRWAAASLLPPALHRPHPCRPPRRRAAAA